MTTTTPSGHSRKSVIIVGGGVIGLCVAYYAMRKGHRVTVIDRATEDHPGCSHKNAGMVVPSHFIPLAAPGMVLTGIKMLGNRESPFSIRPRCSPRLAKWLWMFYRSATRQHVQRASSVLRDLGLESRRSFCELSDGFGHEFGLIQKGLLMLCKKEKTLHEESIIAEKALDLGIEAKILSPSETAKTDPQIQMSIAGSVYFPRDCHLNPSRFLKCLKIALKSGGVTFHWQTNVRKLETRSGAIEKILTDSSEFQADEYVIAGGVWSPQTIHHLGVPLLLEGGKGYSVTLEEPDSLPSICSILTEARVAVTPIDNNLRFAGTMEISGLDDSINPNRIRGIQKSIPKYFPNYQGIDLHKQKIWSGLRPCSPDGLPYIGRTRKHQNLTIATGHAMLGLSLGPITGKLTAEILSNESPSIDLSLL
ncbi:MAG TPA: FAD-dependent oxidoreductase, partial [Verrucomicrobia bacterium]|nr:FAD-dependent oxidoreductase [Verrucomicrobiota bacterium]